VAQAPVTPSQFSEREITALLNLETSTSWGSQLFCIALAADQLQAGSACLVRTSPGIQNKQYQHNLSQTTLECIFFSNVFNSFFLSFFSIFPLLLYTHVQLTNGTALLGAAAASRAPNPLRPVWKSKGYHLSRNRIAFLCLYRPDDK
jgi:hypothetical protein